MNMPIKKYLGIDPGTVRIGLSVADSETRLAVPYDLLEGLTDAEAVEAILGICRDEEVSDIVIGLPISRSSGPTAQTARSQKFIDKIREKIKIPVTTVDERFSSKMAAKLNPKADDSVAAAIILQGHLDQLKMQN
ncbi:MAG: putative holliday junction resolvase [Parcubacteria group bacterium Gr01-1014_18]|nr:MAG: putative holliday junction resolvase [Parcubacteria group bacterium Greene0416_36]TSC80274.1 MAG: putative holliday junction resolvase [Parcubacteria group bacterium Gr01-1014_18]TSC98253.1 MAG: putative holliday junction resolvase [Parcubacteria group bacterium Greene1014_20]TSD07004.1 MAG: putative holliday junction resolvase [Parcubacteria group bacterium Greene0714_2]